MSDVKKYIQTLFNVKSVVVSPNRSHFFDEFVADEKNIAAVEQILENQRMIMSDWNLKNRIQDIAQQSVAIPNGTVGKKYEAFIDPTKNNWNDLTHFQVQLPEDSGLIYSPEDHSVKGIPAQSGDLRITVLYTVEGEKEGTEPHEKQISIAINPDPKSLWKNIDSDSNDPYWKPDNTESADVLGDRFVVASSKRGRSHGNVGSFRDDDYAYKNLGNTGWSIVAVADGAGSAKHSRKGSQLACETVIKWFEENITEEVNAEFDRLAIAHNTQPDGEILKQLNLFLYNHFFKTPKHVQEKLAQFASENGAEPKDFYTTLIYTAFKKYDFGYAIFSFGVGDCPIGLLNPDMTEITLMNWLDVGEYGGGTRFITMPDIISSEKYNSRFKLKFVKDFSYLVLMTDGIYDPKFEVEANLEKIDKWNAFFDDLKGKNDDGTAVDFNRDNPNIAAQLSAWMDFWSPGNHDDRTLAVIF